MIISEIKDNEIVLYNLKLNKNRLKVIRKKIVSKYGKTDDVENIISKDEFDDYNIAKSTPWFSFKRVENDNNEKLYIPIQHPQLAIYISECLNDMMSFQYLAYLKECTSEMEGIEYLPEILDNIKLTEVYRDTFRNGGELIEKILTNAPQDCALRSHFYELRKYILSSSFSDLQKESNTICEEKNMQKDILVKKLKK